jgi:membrane fusion protein
VFPPRAGVIERIHVSDGDSVRRDDVLFNVVDLQSMPDGTDADTQLLSGYANERAALAATRERESSRFAADRAVLLAQLQTASRQAHEVSRLIDVQVDQNELADRQLDALGKLHDSGALPAVEWFSRREQHLQVRERLQATRQSYERIVGERASLTAQLRRLPLEHAERLADLESRETAIERAEVQIRARRNFDVRAPVSGRVVTVKRKVGDTASPSDFALTLIPDDSKLIGRLLIPTTAIGFVEPGQDVRMRYDAFPYQHFGVQVARVRDIARSVLFDGDDYGPLRVTQPAYPASVDLLSQTIGADARDVPLQSGMLFSADIVLERRSILEWAIEPLLGMRGRG